MSLKLYNTRTRSKEEFQPLDPANVRMYVCGPTVYDYAHIGNARPVIVFDVLYRLLRHLAAKGEWDGGKGETKVTYVRNITDVDDKINARAAERYPELPFNEAIRKLTDETAAQYHRDVAALGCLPPTHEPRATEYIAEMTAIIETLVDKGCAYIAEDHALFHVSAMADYGQLARRSLDEMRAGARIEVAPYKRDPMDFVLWKPSKAGEPSWASPRGIGAPGRPGWHLECSAMAKALLGETFDIHGGGIDLVFPHHENEVAQSRCAHGTDIMANVWMHNGHLQVEGAKMSKSDGNFFTIDELLREWPGEVLRLAMLMTHYREPINWTISRLTEARQELWDWVSVGDLFVGYQIANKISVRSFRPKPAESVVAALSDDLNTPQAVTAIRLLAKSARSYDFQAGEALIESLMWLGLYRPYLHDAYDISGISAVPPAYMHKHIDSVRRARAVVLNEYHWDVQDVEVREYNRAKIEQKVNEHNPDLKPDGLRMSLQEHGTVMLEPISSLQEEKLAKEKFALERTAKIFADKRSAARMAKDFPEADRIRDEAATLGILLKEVKDTKTGEITTVPEIAR